MNEINTAARSGLNNKTIPAKIPIEMTLEYETKKMNIYIQEAYFKSTLLQGIESSLKGLKNYIFQATM
ncbi:Uncharacterised protein [Mammaliicoccus fleurettii]|nr:Uncharacterised protein [Mammaliicoccus fleurettii]